jgi:hypothetical protein
MQQRYFVEFSRSRVRWFWRCIWGTRELDFPNQSPPPPLDSTDFTTVNTRKEPENTVYALYIYFLLWSTRQKKTQQIYYIKLKLQEVSREIKLCTYLETLQGYGREVIHPIRSSWYLDFIIYMPKHGHIMYEIITPTSKSRPFLLSQMCQHDIIRTSMKNSLAKLLLAPAITICRSSLLGHSI